MGKGVGGDTKNTDKASQRTGLLVRDSVIFALLFIGIIAGVGVAEYLYVTDHRKDLKSHIREELVGIADIKSRDILDWRKERLSDAGFIFNSNSIAHDLQSLNSGVENSDAASRMQDWMAAMLRNGHYRTIRCLSPAGKQLFWLPASELDGTRETLLNQASGRKSIVFSDLFMNEKNQPEIQIIIPMYVDFKTPDALSGYIQLSIDPQNELFGVVQKWSRPSKSAEALLVSKEGNEAVFLTNARHTPNAPLQLRIPLSSNTPAVQAVQGKEGFVESTDYRNQPVFAALRKIPDSRWFLVVKIDRGEVYADMDSELRLIVLLFLLTVLATAAMILFMLKRIQVHHARSMAEELGRSRALLMSIIEGTTDAIFAKDSAGRYVMSNEACRQFWALPQSGLVGKTISELPFANEASRQSVQSVDERVLETGELLTFEESLHSAQGEEQHFLTTKGPILDEGGNITGLFGIARNITDLKRTEEQLRKFQEAVEQSPVSILITDTEGTIEYVNRRFVELSGYEALEVIGKNPRILKSGRNRPEVYEALWRTLRGGEPWRGELCNKKKDGELYWEDAFIGPVRNSEGRTTHFIAIKQDITAHKKMEEHLLHAQRMESIGTLAGGIAHDLNNVLAPVLISVELLKERTGDELSRQLLTTAETAVHRGKEIIRQVLSFARGMDGERIPVQPRHVLKEIENILRETFPRSIRIVSEIPVELAMVSADVTQLHQVLMNLCLNARDAMAAQGVLTLGARNVAPDELPAEATSERSPLPYVCLYVKDTGTGIPASIRERIFDPFFSTKEIGKGTGLGLSTAYTIVRKHGGFIQVKSDMGHGSTFSVYLPSAGSTINATEAPARVIHRGHGEGILVVDDELFVRNVTQQILESFGYKAYLAGSGKEATQFYAQHQADIALVITDWMMPGMDGAATVRSLKQINPEVKVVVSTGLVEDSTSDPHVASNVCKILNKPYGAHVLLDTIHEVLG